MKKIDIKLPSFGKTFKRAAITAGIVLGLTGAWVGYNNSVAKPEIYMSSKVDKFQTDDVFIEKRAIYPTKQGHKKVLLGFGGWWEREQVEGLNFRLPFETVYDVDTGKIFKIERGYRSKNIGVQTEYEEKDFYDESIMVTGDEAELEVQYAVQYVKKDPSAFLFNVKNPHETLSEVAEAALREIVAKKTYDQALTTDRKEIQKEATQLAQKMLDDYGTGFRIISIFLQPINPPTKEVKEAFDGIIKAMQTKETLIQQGLEKYQKEVEEAEGTKQNMIEQAKGKASELVNTAKGRVARFNELYEGYKQAPDANKYRLWQEAVREVLKNSKTKVTDKELNDGGLLKHLIIDNDPKEGGVK